MVFEMRVSLNPRPALAHTLCPRWKQADLSLNLIANRPSFKEESVFFSRVEQAVKGGATCVQLRDHVNPVKDVIRTAIALKNLITPVPLFVNTQEVLKVAKAAHAEGIFIEEANRLRCSELKNQLGKYIVGMSVWSMADVSIAQQLPWMNYLSVKISPSRLTCQKNDSFWGKEGLKALRKLCKQRIVAVGGLGLEHAEDIYRLLNKEDGIAMAGGILNVENPYETAKKIKAIGHRVRGLP